MAPTPWSFLIIQKRSLQRLTYFVHVLRESKHVSCHLCHDLITAYFYRVLSDSLKGQFQIEPWLQEGRVRGLRFFVDQELVAILPIIGQLFDTVLL